MKNLNIIKCVLLTLVFWLTLYLIGSFGNTDFNIKLWNSESRLLICVFGVFAVITAMCMIHEDKK